LIYSKFGRETVRSDRGREWAPPSPFVANTKLGVHENWVQAKSED